MLTPAAREYLRTYGPIGCRDWSTVDLLLSVGVPAFFSGCLTTTISTVFPEPPAGQRPPRDAPAVYVDVDTPPANALTIRHATREVRAAALVENIRHAIDLLEGYQRHYAKVVTSRLHCYLPCRSVGAAVEFQPVRRADTRFNGLYEATDPEYFDAMRDGLLRKLEAPLAAIVAGRSEAEVYQIWRDACAEDVATAVARHAAVAPMPAPSFDVQAVCATLRDSATTVERSTITGDGPEVHVALALDGNLKEQLRVVAAAMADNSSRPLHLWILCRDHDDRDYEKFAALFPEVTATWLPCDRIDYGPVPGMLKHITVSTMDRLLLPDLLPHLDRVVYHDIDALPLGDVARLYDWDLGGHPLAARASVWREARSGFANIMRSGGWLRNNPARFYELLQRMFARFEYDFPAFNAGILVLDLRRMRADRFCAEFIPFVEQYGMNDQEVLNCYAGPHRAELPPQWNSWPAQEVVPDDVQIIHWAGGMKPWQEPYVLGRDRWDAYVDRVRRRAATAGRVTVPVPREAEPQTVSARVD
jgi:lipopolysaccharide biosynthesis glycosyltransferase